MITVKAGECDLCGGDDLIYVWISESKQLATCCDMCSGCQDLNGDEITIEESVLPATLMQLQKAGFVGQKRG